MAKFSLWLTCVNTSFVFLPLRYTWSFHRFYEESNGEEIPSNRRERKRYVHQQNMNYYKILCRAINIITYVQLDSLVLNGEHWREQSGGLLSMQTCQDLLFSAKNAPNCSTEHSYADAMLCPGLCLDVSLWVSIHDSQTIWALRSKISDQYDDLRRMQTIDWSLSVEWGQIFVSHFLTILVRVPCPNHQVVEPKHIVHYCLNISFSFWQMASWIQNDREDSGRQATKKIFCLFIFCLVSCVLFEIMISLDLHFNLHLNILIKQQ